MKRIKFLLAVCASLFLMTGCVKYNATMEVKADKSMDFKILYALDFSMAGTDDTETTSEIMSPEDKKKFEEAGYKVENYNEGNYQGVILTYSVDNIDNISKEDDFTLKLSDMMSEDTKKNEFFTVKKGIFKNTYKAKYVFETNDSDEGDDSIDMSAYLKNLDLKFAVKLPNGAKSNNATSVNGNTYEWDLTKNTTSDISFEFDMYNMTNIYIVIGAAVAIFVLVVIVVALLVTRKKKA